jgi:hypothetical protein
VQAVQIARCESVRCSDFRVHELDRIIHVVQTHDVPQFVLHDGQDVIGPFRQPGVQYTCGVSSSKLPVM